MTHLLLVGLVALLAGAFWAGLYVWMVGTSGLIGRLRAERLHSATPLLPRLVWLVPLGALCGATAATLILLLASAGGAPAYPALRDIGPADLMSHVAMGAMAGTFATTLVYRAWLHGLNASVLRRIGGLAFASVVLSGAGGAALDGPGLAFFAAVVVFGFVCWFAALRAWRSFPV